MNTVVLANVSDWQGTGRLIGSLAMLDESSIHSEPRAEVLGFAWDRQETADSLRAKLAEASPRQWVELVSWIMREARVDEVWAFVRPEEIAEHFDALEPRLGRRRKLWNYLLETWREMGRL